MNGECNMADKEMVLILDFGGQYNQLIARRVREANVYCEVVPYDYSLDEIRKKNPKGIIFTGGPASVYEEGAPKCDPGVFGMGVPILGICYGAQLMAHMLGGKVARAVKREYGKTQVKLLEDSLFKEVPQDSICWMSHTVYVDSPPSGFDIIGTTETCPVAAMGNKSGKLYGVQFHPEVEHTEYGKQILRNFLYDICGLSGDWTMGNFIDENVVRIKELAGDKKVICALSGGVDSSVAAVLMHKAIGNRLTCIFVDHGLLRKNEAEQVEEVFRKRFDINLIKIDAQDRFLNKLKGVSDPERKRKIIGEEFIRVFEEEANKLGEIDFLVQGTIYPDVIESGTKTAAVIKSHHNVGGLPENMQLKLIEPLRELFKDEVRLVGLELGLPEDLVWRQPFPGPGLGIRVLGEITKEKLHIVKESDAILREEIKNAGLDRCIWQYFTALPDIRSVGVMGDERTYSHTVAIRAVTSSDAMTADWARIPYEVLEKISNRIVNEVEHVNRVMYDITSKPPATIEFE